MKAPHFSLNKLLAVALLTPCGVLPFSAWGQTSYIGPNLGSWDDAANWSPATVPNSVGAEVTFGATASRQVYASNSTATTMTFGNLTTTTNQNVLLGDSTSADLGSFIINNPGGAVWAVSSSLISGRGIYLRGNKLNHFTLSSNLTVNLNAGTNTGREFGIARSTGTDAVINGGGNTITLNGGLLALGGSGLNGEPASNVTFDLRTAESLALSMAGNLAAASTDVTILIGNSGGQTARVNGSINLAYAIQLHGNLTFDASGTRSLTLNSTISDGSGSNRVTYATTGSAGLNVNIAGPSANTYTGGTTINLAGTGSGNTTTATKGGAFGTGDLALLAGRVVLGGNQTVAGLSGSTGTEIVGNSATTTRVLTLNQASSSFTYNGTLGNGTTAGNNLAIVKNGNGTQALTGNNLYTGGTTVNAGTLLINNTAGSGTGTGAVVVNSGGTLGGNGSIAGATTINGTLSPGNSFGLLTFNGSLTLNSGSTTFMEIGATTTRGGTFDAIDVGTALTYGGGLTLNMTTTYGVGTYSWNLFEFGSQTGSFNTVSLAGSYSGSLVNTLGTWSLTSGTETWTFTQSDGVLALNVIPEPSTIALLGLGAGALLWLRRRRQRV